MASWPMATTAGDLTVFIGDLGVPLTALNCKLNRNKTCTVTATMKVKSKTQLDQLLSRLQRRTDVIEAFRANG